MIGRRAELSDEEFIGIMRAYREDRLAMIEASAEDAVPAHTDEAAGRAFRQMEVWIARGAFPAAAGKVLRRGIACGAALRAVIAAVSAAALLSAGSYALFPSVRSAVDAALCRTEAQTAAPFSEKAPADYTIPWPGEGYELREDVTGEAMIAKWFTAERRLLMVQIAYELPEVPEGAGEYVDLGGMVGFAYEADGDRQLLIRDGAVSILIKMFNADPEELLDYAAAFAAANDTQ